MRGWIRGGIAAAACAAALLGATAYSGAQLRKALLAQPRQWAQAYPFVQVHELRYDKGFASSTRTTTLEFGCPGSEPLRVTWRDRIEHGPLPGGTALGAALIHSELVLDDALRARLAQALGGAAPRLSARTRVHFGGGFTTDVELTPFAVALARGGAANVQGLQLHWRQDAGGTSYRLTMPGVALDDPAQGLAIRVTGITLSGEGLSLPGLWWAMAGAGSGEIAEIDVGLRAPEREPFRFALQGVKLVADGSLDKQGLYSGTSSLAATQGQIGTSRLERLEMRASARRLHAASYGTLMNGLIGGACSRHAIEREREVLLRAMLDLLPHGPEYALERLVVRVDGQEASMSYAFGVNGVTEADVRGGLAPALLDKATFRFDAHVPAAWIEHLPLPRVTGERSLAPVTMVDGLVEQGVLQRDGALLGLRMELGAGVLSVNGRSIPLPAAR